LKRVEGNRVWLTVEQKAKLFVFAADHSHLSREAVINWAVKKFDLKETPAPSLITSLKRTQRSNGPRIIFCKRLSPRNCSPNQPRSATTLNLKVNFLHGLPDWNTAKL
jgi:hypothetical protein